jgi:redox-sensitive bicupin YhaK (pirin superfamily)
MIPCAAGRPLSRNIGGMITLRRSEERGHFNHGWLDTYHTFSFASYFDPNHMGFRALRVLNDDTIAPGRGFGAHGHRDMEIVTYVLSGKLAHKDSMGQSRVLEPNMAQAMSAGTGVIHSEFNGSNTEPVHLLQIWILPAVEDAEPSYQEFAYSPEEKHGRLRLIAGPENNSKERAAIIRQDARMYGCVLDPGKTIEQPIAKGRHAWVHCALGNIILNGHELKQGDGAAVSEEAALQIAGAGPKGGEFLVFDLA